MPLRGNVPYPQLKEKEANRGLKSPQGLEGSAGTGNTKASRIFTNRFSRKLMPARSSANALRAVT